MNKKQTNRDAFASRSGFIVSCIGAAVGMGNIWMFPYRVGEFGGTFFIPYLLMIVLLGFTGVIGEMALGRAMRTGPVGAFENAFAQRGWKGGKYIGMLPILAALGIGIGYSVVVGWILRYTYSALSADVMTHNAGEFFGTFAVEFGSVPWHIAAVVVTFLIMYFGIAKGIEKVNKVLMPLFFVLFIVLAIWVATLDNASTGYAYLLNFDLSLLATPKIWIYAMGQAFFSLSLAGSCTVVYGSYLKKEDDLVNSAFWVALFDTLAAVLASMVILPAVFAYNLEPNAGPPLMFITLPTVFQNMPGGQLVASIFFIAVLFAGITSLMNLFEAPVEMLQSTFHLARVPALACVALPAFAVSIFLEGDRLSPWMDFFSIYMVPLGALLAGVFFFWVCKPGFAREHVQMGRDGKLGAWFEPVTKYVFCGVSLLVLVMGAVYGGIG